MAFADADIRTGSTETSSGMISPTREMSTTAEFLNLLAGSDPRGCCTRTWHSDARGWTRPRLLPAQARRAASQSAVAQSQSPLGPAAARGGDTNTKKPTRLLVPLRRGAHP